MNAYTSQEAYFKDLLKYVDQVMAAYYEANYSQQDNFELGWQLKRISPKSQQMKEEAFVIWNRIRTQAEMTMSTSNLLPLEHLIETFKLADFEIFCLYVSLAIELDPSFEKNIRYFNESLPLPYPSLGLLLKMYCDSLSAYLHLRQQFKSDHRLFKYFYSDSLKNAVGPMINAPLALDQPILDFVLAFDTYAVSKPYMALISPHTQDEVHYFPEIEKRLQSYVTLNHTQALDQHVLFHLHGEKGIGKHALTYSFCSHYDQNALLVQCKLLSSELTSETIDAITREALMHRAVVVFEDFESLTTQLNQRDVSQFMPLLLKALKRFAKVCFAFSQEPWHPQSLFESFLIIDVPLVSPNLSERFTYWKNSGQNFPLAEDIAFETLANQFKLGPKQIDKALRDAHQQMLWEHTSQISLSQLQQANYFQLSHALGENTQRLRGKATFKDLVLPKEQLSQLTDACNHMRYRHIVLQEWGFEDKLSYGTGLGILFTGPPGTGKTFAAQALANELGLELYRVDLSQIISKYIGETEKQLRAIFEEASKSSAILLFDEGDALFSKRTEVSDAHDKYANVETSYLLQKIEAYDGITIVTTNLIGNIDEAFIRRFAFVVHFPLPTAAYRRTLWRQVFPPQMPLSSHLDLDYMGNHFELSGASIKNIALNASYMAAASQRELTMKDLLLATMAELTKTGKSVLPSDFGDYSYLLSTDFRAP